MFARLRNLHFKYTVQDSGELHAHGLEDMLSLIIH